jgi:hypothetical protein
MLSATSQGKNKVLLTLLKTFSNSNADAANKLKSKLDALQRDLHAIQALSEECAAGFMMPTADISKLESSMTFDSDDDYSPMKTIENCEELNEDEADKQGRLSTSPLAHRVYRRASRSRSPKPRQIGDIDISNTVYESGKKRSYSGTQFASPDDVASPKKPYGSQLSGVTKESMTPWPKAFSTGSPMTEKGQRGENEGQGYGGQVGVTGSFDTAVDVYASRDRIGSEFTVTQTGLSDSESDSGGEEVLDSGGGGSAGSGEGGVVPVEENFEVVEDVIEHLMVDIGADIGKDGAKGGGGDDGEGDNGCMDVDAVDGVSKEKEDAISQDKALSLDPDAGNDGQGEAEEGQKSKDDISERDDVNGQNHDEDLEPESEGKKKVNGENGVTTDRTAENDRQMRATGSSQSPSPVSPKSPHPAPADPSLSLPLSEGPNTSPSGGVSSGIPAKIPPIEFSSPRPNSPHCGVEASGGAFKTTGITAELNRSSISNKLSKSSSQNDRDRAVEGDSDERREEDKEFRNLSSIARRDVCDVLVSLGKEREREREGDDRGEGDGAEEGSSGSDIEQDEAGEVDELVESSSNDESKIHTRKAYQYSSERGDSQTAIAQDRPIEETFDTQAAYHNT